MKIFAALSSLLSLSGDKIAEHLRGARRSLQFNSTNTTGANFTGPKVKNLLWINADTDQREAVNDNVVVRIIALNDHQFWRPGEIDGHEVPSPNMTMEAVFENGTVVRSVKFTFEGQTILENTAPWALCGNSGRNFFPCAGLGRAGGRVTAQAFTERNGMGQAGPVLETYIRYFRYGPPAGFIEYYNADTERTLGYQYDPVTTINITKTPRVAIGFSLYDHQRNRWIPQSARFSLNNDTMIKEGNVPVFFPGNNGTDRMGFTPSIGNNDISATVYKRIDMQGQSYSTMHNFMVVS